MYFVDRELIEKRLTFLNEQIQLFETLETKQSRLEKVALERMTHLMIEVVLDVGNAMIDGFIMRDPGSYEDIIDILEDEKVITAEMSTTFKEMVAYRKILVQDYTAINHEDLRETFVRILPFIADFPSKVRQYLTNELGPVSAFKN